MKENNNTNKREKSLTKKTKTFPFPRGINLLAEIKRPHVSQRSIQIEFCNRLLLSHYGLRSENSQSATEPHSSFSYDQIFRWNRMARPMWLTSRVILNELNARRTRSCKSTDLLSLSSLQCDTLSLQYWMRAVFAFAVAAVAADNTGAAVCVCLCIGHEAYPLRLLFVCLYLQFHT